MFTRSFTVRGRGTFPFDMLRYDTCHPATAEDAIKLGEKDLRVVRLTMQTRTKIRVPTEDRWTSFGWTVTEIGNPAKA